MLAAFFEVILWMLLRFWSTRCSCHESASFCNVSFLAIIKVHEAPVFPPNLSPLFWSSQLSWTYRIKLALLSVKHMITFFHWLPLKLFQVLLKVFRPCGVIYHYFRWFPAKGRQFWKFLFNAKERHRFSIQRMAPDHATHFLSCFQKIFLPSCLYSTEQLS